MAETIVFTNGCFDLFHAGHLSLLYQAKRLGDQLYVGINSDKSIFCYLDKGHDRPIIPEGERFEIVASIKYVDRVFMFDEPTPKELIESIQPDIIVKGGDYKPEDVVGNHIAKVVIVPLLRDISTSKIVDDIRHDI
jgi:rfaE bifunctional protein nucleotidyltransferase chain/domain